MRDISCTLIRSILYLYLQKVYKKNTFQRYFNEKKHDKNTSDVIMYVCRINYYICNSHVMFLFRGTLIL